jgi:hypothetical protein
MAWLAICLPVMAVGVAIATVPLAIATRHQHKYGHHGSNPHHRGVAASAPAPMPTSDPGWTVCPNCTAVVADQAIHDSTVHAMA